MKLEEYGYALNDASKLQVVLGMRGYIDHNKPGQAIELDPTYAKAYYRCVRSPCCIQVIPILKSPSRRGTCHLQILKYAQAIADFKKVVKLEPTNDLVKTQLASTQKLVRKIEFEKVNFGLLHPRLPMYLLTVRLGYRVRRRKGSNRKMSRDHRRRSAS